MGRSVDTQNFSGTPQLMYPQAQGFVIGAAGTGGNFVGSMDDFYLFGSVLSASQIQKVYQNQVIYFGSALPANTPVQVASGATLDLGGVSQTIDSLANSGVSGGTVTNSVAGTATLTLAPAGSTTFSGRIQNGTGKVALALAGPGTQVFASSNTYTGGTTIDGGILVAANAQRLGHRQRPRHPQRRHLGQRRQRLDLRQRGRQFRGLGNRPRRPRLDRTLDRRQPGHRLEPDHAELRPHHAERQQ